MEQQTGSKLGKEHIKAYVYWHPAYLYAEYIMRNTGLDEAQAEIRISGRNTNNLIYADGTILMAESEEELKILLRRTKDPLDESERGEWKSWVKAQHSEN